MDAPLVNGDTTTTTPAFDDTTAPPRRSSGRVRRTATPNTPPLAAIPASPALSAPGTDTSTTPGPTSSTGPTPFSPGPAHASYGPGPSNPNPNPSQSERDRVSGRMDREGRINWWRLYRFPPIVARGEGGVSAGAATTTPATMTATPAVRTAAAGTQTEVQRAGEPEEQSQTPAQGDVSSPISSRTVDDRGPTAVGTIPVQPEPRAPVDTTTTPPPPASASIPLNSVVPVILVGLQSVNQADGHVHLPGQPHTGGGTGRRRGRTPIPDDEFGFLGRSGEYVDDEEYDEHDNDEDEDESGDEDEEEDEWEAAERERERREAERRESRASRWQSRAANAIRNLRGGSRRREGAPGGGATTGGDARTPDIQLNAPGSRTFLIYVIGGEFFCFFYFWGLDAEI